MGLGSFIEASILEESFKPWYSWLHTISSQTYTPQCHNRTVHLAVCGICCTRNIHRSSLLMLDGATAAHRNLKCI
jgi:hypothetical protein